jgi:hypothetical protein
MSGSAYETPRVDNGYRYTVERQRLCAWLEDEKQKVASLADPDRTQRTLELEREFRIRLDALYVQVKTEFEPA